MRTSSMVHVLLGAIALLAGAAVIASRKGDRRHRRLGGVGARFTVRSCRSRSCRR